DQLTHGPVLDFAAERPAFAFVALTGDEAFFLRGKHNRCSSRQRVARLTVTRLLAVSTACNSFSVASGCAATAVRSTARCSSFNAGAAPPLWGWGTSDSPRRCRPSILTM